MGVALQPTLGEVAYTLVLFDKIRAMRAKGRPLTVRALSQWHSQSCVGDVDKLVLEAATFASAFGVRIDTDRLTEVVRRILIDQLLRRRRRGRPTTKPTGLLASSSAARRRPGRPQRVPSSDARYWVSEILGARLGLLADEVLGRRSADSAATALHRQLSGAGSPRELDDLAVMCRYLERNPDALDRISAAQAIRRLAERDGKPIGTCEVARLTARYRRLTRTLDLKLPATKSGG